VRAARCDDVGTAAQAVIRNEVTVKNATAAVAAPLDIAKTPDLRARFIFSS
jgi:hypothetical protein